MDRVFYQDDYATIELDDSIPCVTMTLNGVPRSSEHFHTIQAKRLELIGAERRNYPKLHLLTDSRNAGPVLEEDVAFFKSSVVPEIEKAGIRCFAIVLANGKLSKVSVEGLTQKTSPLMIRTFDSMREAKLWLRKMTLA